MAGLPLLALSPGHAAAAGTGSISGIVTHASIGPLEDICVDAYDSSGVRAGYATSNANGNYTVIGLPSGDYRLEYRSCSYPKLNVAPEYYDDKGTLSEATPVSVTAGAETPGVNVEMATGGSISGNAGGASGGEGFYCLSGASVYDSNGEFVSSAIADSNTGAYKIDRLRAGEYRVEFRRGCMGANPSVDVPSPTSSFWNEAETLADATPISVTEGSDVSGIDVWTGPYTGRWISGTVRNESGAPLKAICVTALDTEGNLLGIGTFGATGPNGTFRLERLKTGDYILKFEDCLDAYIYPDEVEFYEDMTTFEDATPVTIGAGEDGVSGIDVTLATQGYSDTTPPDTIIDSGPSGTITTNEATFSFRSTEPEWFTPYVQCSIDSGAFEPCTSPKTFSGLSDGEHTVAFRAEDYFGNQDQTPATRTFTVDTAVYKATISKLGVTGPAKVRNGRKATYRVKITNSGNARATAVRLRVKGRGDNSNTSVGTISAGSARTIRVRLKLRKPGRTKLTFRVTSSNAGGKTVRRGITVKK